MEDKKGKLTSFGFEPCAIKNESCSLLMSNKVSHVFYLYGQKLCNLQILINLLSQSLPGNYKPFRSFPLHSYQYPMFTRILCM